METKNKQETFSDIIRGNKAVVVDFFAEWCGPCKMMKPVLEELYHDLGENIRILKIDIDKAPAVAESFEIHGVPTLMLFQNGKMLWRQSGVIPAKQLKKIIEQNASLI